MSHKYSTKDLKKLGYTPVIVVNNNEYWTGKYFVACKRRALVFSSVEIAKCYMNQYNIVGEIKKV